MKYIYLLLGSVVNRLLELANGGFSEIDLKFV